MSITNLQQKVATLANQIDDEYTDIDSDIIDSDSESTIADSEIEEENDLVEKEIVEIEPEPEPVKKAKRKYTKRQPKPTIKTSDENVEIRLATKKRGPRKRVITVFKEDLPVEPITIVEKVRRGKGRPKKDKLVEIVQEPDEPDVIAFERPSKVKMSARDLKKMELEVRLLELQSVTGNSNLKMTKAGKIDGRQSKQRTQKQLDATARLVESNKLKRMQKKQAEKDEVLTEQKIVVNNIISSLNEAQVVDTKNSEKEAKMKADRATKDADTKKKNMSLFD